MTVKHFTYQVTFFIALGLTSVALCICICVYNSYIANVYINELMTLPYIAIATLAIEFLQFNASPDCPPHHMSMSNSHYMCTRRLYVTITQNRSHILHRLIIIRRKTFLAILIRMCDSKSVYTQLYMTYKIRSIWAWKLCVCICI